MNIKQKMRPVLRKLVKARQQATGVRDKDVGSIGDVTAAIDELAEVKGNIVEAVTEINGMLDNSPNIRIPEVPGSATPTKQPIPQPVEEV